MVPDSIASIEYHPYIPPRQDTLCGKLGCTHWATQSVKVTYVSGHMVWRLLCHAHANEWYNRLTGGTLNNEST